MQLFYRPSLNTAWQLLDAVSHVDDFGQYLVRALIYRSVTDWLFGVDDPAATSHHDPWSPAIDLACQRASSTAAVSGLPHKRNS